MLHPCHSLWAAPEPHLRPCTEPAWLPPPLSTPKRIRKCFPQPPHQNQRRLRVTTTDSGTSCAPAPAQLLRVLPPAPPPHHGAPQASILALVLCDFPDHPVLCHGSNWVSVPAQTSLPTTDTIADITPSPLCSTGSATAGTAHPVLRVQLPATMPLPPTAHEGRPLDTAVTPAPTRHNEGSAAFRGTHPPPQEAPLTPRLPQLPPDGQRGQSLWEMPPAAHHRAGAHSIPGSPAATTPWFPAVCRLQAPWTRPPLAQSPLLSTAWPTSWKKPLSPALPTPPHPVRSSPAQKSPSRGGHSPYC